MIQDYRQLVREIADLTGAAPPPLLEEGAPVLLGAALDEGGPGFYLVGLIGGKDVGKSALVNALVGRQITAQTSSGPGTEIVIAYAHQQQAEALKELLEREVPGQYRIVTHALPHLLRQVLLDLPDIDSHYAAHVEVSRRMLKHMLFPLWIQSIEKYADQRPRELLSLVASGNAPGNFIFCLNKVDQIMQREGPPAAEELRQDYAGRLGRLLSLPQPPRVWMISAIHPERYDLPALRQLLAEQKSEEAVDVSRQLAVRRQGLSLAQWVERQDLPRRLAVIDRLGSVAEEELSARVGLPLIEGALPRLLEDPAYRLALTDELMQKRTEKWPIVNVLHVLLGPLMFLLRRRLPLAQQQALVSADDLVHLHLQTLDGAGVGGQSLAARVQSTFAFLQQSSPLIGRLYEQQRLWEALPAQQAEADLRQRLAATIERQRGIIRSRLSLGGVIRALFRWVLTFGAIVWFPFAQPLLQAYLSGSGLQRLLIFGVELLGVSYLLSNVIFLGIYFLILWLILKWDTQRRVDRWLAQWKGAEKLDPTLSLPGQVLEWMGGLLSPVRAARQKLGDLSHRAAELRQRLLRQEAA